MLCFRSVLHVLPNESGICREGSKPALRITKVPELWYKEKGQGLPFPASKRRRERACFLPRMNEASKCFAEPLPRACTDRGIALLDWKFYSAVVFVCVAVGSFLYKKAQVEGVRPGSFMMVQSFCFFCTALAASLVKQGGLASGPYPWLGILAGSLGMTGAFSTLGSMKQGELGTNIAVVRLSFVPTTIGAILLLGEPFTMQKGILFLLAGLAVSLFFDHYRKANRLALQSLVPALIACMAFGVFDIVYKFASTQKVNPLTFLIVQSATAHILIHLYVALREGYALNRPVFRIAPLCGILFASACLAMLRALREVDVSLISPFIQMNFILSYLLGVVFLGESVTRRKLLGITIVALCVLLLSENFSDWLHDLGAAAICP